MRYLLLAAVLALSGCALLFPDRRVWQRMDGQRMSADATLQQQFYQANYECQSQSAPVAATPAGPAVAIGRNATAVASNAATVAADNLFQACMSARGYKFALPPTG